MERLLLISLSGINNVKATGVPFGGQGGSLAQACNIRNDKLQREVHGGHSIKIRLGASRNVPSFV